MAQPDPSRTNVTEFSVRRAPREPKGDHAWLVAHLISLIGYAERHGLTEVEEALAQAAERVAPAVKPAADAERRPDPLVYLRRPYPEKRD
ncbi:hypothetical protein [Cereibacter sediminicola]|uniref:hypothetical protein n=1 Tax=Cereibacter sediminicola TaxID=2584941 RepID=UPI00119CBAD3|nr:hypothetical protein [Cereibacter sediminicola]